MPLADTRFPLQSVARPLLPVSQQAVVCLLPLGWRLSLTVPVGRSLQFPASGVSGLSHRPSYRPAVRPSSKWPTTSSTRPSILRFTVGCPSLTGSVSGMPPAAPVLRLGAGLSRNNPSALAIWTASPISSSAGFYPSRCLLQSRQECYVRTAALPIVCCWRGRNVTSAETALSPFPSSAVESSAAGRAGLLRLPRPSKLSKLSI